MCAGMQLCDRYVGRTSMPLKFVKYVQLLIARFFHGGWEAMDVDK